MLPCGTVLVLGSLQVMTESNPGMVRGLLVIAGLVMLGGFTMMFGSLLIVLCRMFVMLVNLVLCHFVLPDFEPLRPADNAQRLKVALRGSQECAGIQ